MRLLGGPIPRAIELTVEAAKGCEKVLEVAAGTGLFTIAVASRWAIGCRRLRRSDGGHALTEHRAARLTNVSCERADLYALAYPPASFDAVIAANVLHLVPNLPHALAAMRAVLRPGGRLIVPTFCHDEPPLSWLSSRVIALTGFPGHRRFTAISLSTELRHAGSLSKSAKQSRGCSR
jgi:phosphatidylethanolamine/phosphatidyl-N-methylethanolamine N-methyltransferase